MLNKRVFTAAAGIFIVAVMLISGCSGVVQGPAGTDRGDTGQPQAKEYVLKGIGYFSQKQWDEAIAQYTRAIEIDPNYALAFSNRGSAYGEKGDYNRAIADYTKAIELAPTLAETYRNRGIAYGKKGDYDNAIGDFTTGITLDPRDALSYYNRGAAYDKKGEKGKADADFKKARELGLK